MYGRLRFCQQTIAVIVKSPYRVEERETGVALQCTLLKANTFGGHLRTPVRMTSCPSVLHLIRDDVGLEYSQPDAGSPASKSSITLKSTIWPHGHYGLTPLSNFALYQRPMRHGVYLRGLLLLPGQEQAQYAFIVSRSA